jgi:hypothetical protein
LKWKIKNLNASLAASLLRENPFKKKKPKNYTVIYFSTAAPGSHWENLGGKMYHPR